MAGHEFQHYSLGSLGVDSNLSTLDSRNQPASIWLVGCCPILWLIVSTNGNNNKDGSLLQFYWVVTRRLIRNNDQHTTTIKVSGCGEQPSTLWMVYCNTFHHMFFFAVMSIGNNLLPLNWLIGRSARLFAATHVNGTIGTTSLYDMARVLFCSFHGDVNGLILVKNFTDLMHRQHPKTTEGSKRSRRSKTNAKCKRASID